MALSRIWAAFIIVSILAAGFLCVFTKNNADIFSRMVTGKSDDTSQTKFADTSVMPATILQTLQSGQEYKDGNLKFSKGANGKYISYKEQNADGVIATTKSVVDISINLIGIMALFMGFMSIAERAGGIRLLSKIIAPFFSKLFPELPRNHLAMGHMVMNFSANLLGLDNAATPFGIKAIESLQTINPKKGYGVQRTDNVFVFTCFGPYPDTRKHNCCAGIFKSGKSYRHFYPLYDSHLCRYYGCHAHRIVQAKK